MTHASSQLSMFAPPTASAGGLDRPYMPILLDRQGELSALAQLPEATWAALTPFVQLTPPELRGRGDQPGAPVAWMARLARAVTRHPIYLDLAGVERRSRSAPRLDAAFVEGTYALADTFGITLAPVYPVGRTDLSQVIAAVARRGGLGAALRFRASDLTAQGTRSLPAMVAAEADALGLSAGELDLVLDLGYLDPDQEIDADELQAMVERLEGAFPWRSIAVAATAVPDTVARDIGEDTLGGIARRDWELWRALRRRLDRPLRYADYAIQHSMPPDPVNAPAMRASIRYTAGDYIYVARGAGPIRSLSAEAKSAQYRELATRLIHHPSFVGRECCSGDRYIEDCADGTRTVRAQQVWRAIGTLHHLCAVAADVAHEVAARSRGQTGRAHVRSATPSPAQSRRQARIVRTAPVATRDKHANPAP